jgi:uncharacterized DUF497 family protein
MKSKLSIVIALLIVFVNASCSEKHAEEFSFASDMQSEAKDATSTSESEKVVTETTEEPSKTQKIERMLIKEAYIDFETNDLDLSRNNIVEVTKKYKGYIASDRTNNLSNKNNTTIVVRIPSVDFDSFLYDATKSIENFDRKDIDVKDVTEEFLDVQARLKTKKELESRLLTLVKQSSKIADIIEIEKQLTELRSDIESIEGRLKYLQSQVSMSTLTITFYKQVPNVASFGQKFINGFHNGWEYLIWFFVILTNIWPFILLSVLLVITIKWYKKRKNNS